ncbi:GerAB/ArcD/ProY family transporter [Clostridium folliculivorans]|uniref:Spore germination protein KB n=1 Tax=Clostridium folliculivorans TaxID=2886038 RepID=A0A9W5Y5K1_9CLOT|nr:spore germination protein [Clostridium folliculivorans]GKU26847.1 spore germination protein KB [Clostridium folliculivorans]GKU31498.1 spore germination protein KB [Clostridium folliculivorans]
MNSKISSRQFLRMMILFQLGSAIAIPLATSAKQDAWIVILMGMTFGTILTFMYVNIFNKTEGNNLGKILEELLGKRLGKFISLLYIAYFLYTANRVINDFRIIIKSTALPQTPNIMIIFIMSIPVIYCVYLGIEAMGRGAVLLYKTVMFTVVILFGFAFINKLPKLERLEPVLEYGWGPIIKVLFPLAIAVPYGETITFMNIYSNVTDKDAHKIRKTALFSNIISGLILALTSAINVAIISATIVEISIFPVLKTVGSIQIGTFIQRLDVLAILLLMLGGFYKILIFFYCSVEMTMTVFEVDLKHRNILIVILGIIMIFLSYFLMVNPIQHFHIGLEIVPLYVHVPLQFIIPGILFIISVAGKKNRYSKTLR